MSPTAAASSSALENVAVEVAEIAAEYVRSQRGKAILAATKSSPTDVVTDTDIACEQLIRAELAGRSPGSTVIGEELTDVAGGSNVGWIVDPIDGTVNFSYDLPVVAVSIAATVDGKVVAGAVVDVHRVETFSAALGGGARRDAQSIRPSRVASLDQSLVGTGFAYGAELRAHQASVLVGLLPACRDIRCMGSAALNLCWVGCGRLDGFYQLDLELYDHAAGALIASEAGATVEFHETVEGTSTIAASPGILAPLWGLVGSA